jgi:hypothetical protein
MGYSPQFRRDAYYPTGDRSGRVLILPMHVRIRDCHGDPLALRALWLATHGWQTLHNIIRGEHDLPNRY